ncbi:MAG: tyrosine-type recombinase/integrase [Syntrophobacteraceae bacterium]|jgi:site-specific recombinase XerD
MGNEAGRVIEFPGTRERVSPKAPRQIQNIDGVKYYTDQQIKLLRRTVRDQAALDLERSQVTAIREWMAVDLITSSGLRVSEAANIRCGDLKAGYGECALFVRDGKGSKSRTVQIPDSLKRHLKQFVAWKASRGEPIGPDDYLLIGQRGPWTAQAIQQLVKKYLKSLGLYENEKSVHALRHSYAVEFYKQQKDLRALQKQLGHSSIETTQIYADVTAEDIQKQIRGLWG